jgi:flagellar basal-body rod protein FlgC
MDTIATNLANINTVITPAGTPYRRQSVVFQQTGQGGVRVGGVVQDSSAFREEYNPSSPLADKKTGIVSMPNVNPVTEMVDLIAASRAYEANVTAFNAAKTMVLKALEIGKV